MIFAGWRAYLCIYKTAVAQRLAVERGLSVNEKFETPLRDKSRITVRAIVCIIPVQRRCMFLSDFAVIIYTCLFSYITVVALLQEQTGGFPANSSYSLVCHPVR